ncbi:GRAS family protein [Streptomyces sp. CBMA152]|uniref:GRAS family protein n=1 Tax=Streptomyces sp. CBMA152 TaxID=1896312 RepID=UPI00166122C1|nr:GRAS family protein [Streptomyces sp. CBMA152]MBD0741377.1 hypothetical protein [Streptomyces sp. CBMA152]
MIEEFDLLTRAVGHIHAERPAQAAPMLDRLRAVLDGRARPKPGDRLCRLYLEALTHRIGAEPGHADETNLYRQQYADHAQIDLYYLLCEHLPFMHTTPAVTNLLAAPLQRDGVEQAVVLSIGIGHARQEAALLDELARPGAPLRRCTVVGIDPDAESLAKAERRLRESDAVAKHGLELDFLPVPRIAEEVEPADWQCIAALDGVLVVNSTLAVHHMQDAAPGHDARDEFFQRLRLLAPAVVVLTEFDSDHHDVSLPQRFFNSWHFFGSILRAIEDSAATDAEKDLMTTFFRREVMNIVGARTDAQRFERHEPARAWLERLHRCGFAPVCPDPALDTAHGHHAVHATSDHVRLTCRDRTICAVIAAGPAG